MPEYFADDVIPLVCTANTRIVCCTCATLSKLVHQTFGVQEKIPIRFLDARCDSSERGITVQFPLHHCQCPEKNIVQFFSGPQVLENLTMLDSALIVVHFDPYMDVKKAIPYQLLRQVLKFCVLPVLVIDHMEKAVHMEDVDAAFAVLTGLVQEFEQFLESNQSLHKNVLPKFDVSQHVIFVGSIWLFGFTLAQFEAKYQEKFKSSQVKGNLWGHVFYDQDAKQFVNTSVSSSDKPLQPTFIKFILHPIRSLYTTALSSAEMAGNYLKQLGIELPPHQDVTYTPGKQLAKLCLSTWLPLPECVIVAVVRACPTVIQAQGYRVNAICKIPTNDAYATAISQPSIDGPLIAYCAGTYVNEKKQVSLLRVFSGTLKLNHQYYRDEQSNTCIAVRCLMNFSDPKPVNLDLPFGGIFLVLMQPATQYCTVSSVPTLQLKTLALLTKPVLQQSVSSLQAYDIGNFMDGLRRIQAFKPFVTPLFSETDSYIQASAEYMFKDAIEYLNSCVYNGGIKQGELEVIYMETIVGTCKPIVSVSPNRHNRLTFTAAPLPDALMTSGILFNANNAPQFVKFGIDEQTVKEICLFGQYCILSIDSKLNETFVKEIMASIEAAFNWVVKEPVLSEKYQMYGVHYRITSITLMTDAIHRGGGQIIPTVRNGLRNAFLASDPRLLEPVFEITIEGIHEVHLAALYQYMNEHHGSIFEEVQEAPCSYTLKVLQPVQSSLGMQDAIDTITGFTASVTFAFSHYQLMQESPYEGKCKQLIEKARLAVGLKPDVPKFVE